MLRMAFLIFTFEFCTVGCAGKQDYQVFSADQRDEVLAKAVVVEGRVIESRHTLGPIARDYVFFFLPTGISVKNPRYDASIAVDRVLKGQVASKTIELRDYRPLTTEELALFVDGGGILKHRVLRIGYDRVNGGRFANLAIVPLGNTPEFDAALRSFPPSTGTATPTIPAHVCRARPICDTRPQHLTPPKFLTDNARESTGASSCAAGRHDHW